MGLLPDGCLDFVYADPPFFTGRELRGSAAKRKGKADVVIPGGEVPVFSDAWPGGLAEYLAWLSARLAEMRRLLGPRGTLVLHCDHHACHYLKVELDRLFGPGSFVNEIIWCYKSGGASPKRHFSRKHDNLFLYAMGPSYYFKPQREKSYNRELKPYRFAGVEEHQDAMGWYTLVGMKDYWELDMVGRTSAERLGYPTQKPERLLERLLVSLAPEGVTVGDFFSGSGTTAAVAQRLGLGFIASDDS
ncbi:MAG: site-specific DNA-methyltransferase, partial [Polyangia bacterium]|nr:site-specific DNA-methyltransferase [Polyangia bacterium]